MRRRLSRETAAMTTSCHIALHQLPELVGQEIAVTDWFEIDQSRIDAFAKATGDEQWIHVDPVRAAQGPFGKTVAHGFLTLSLLPALMHRNIEFIDMRMGINYGLDRVRFVHPVTVGSRIRLRVVLHEVTAIDGGWQATEDVTVEIEGVSKPACVARMLARFFPN